MVGDVWDVNLYFITPSPLRTGWYQVLVSAAAAQRAAWRAASGVNDSDRFW